MLYGLIGYPLTHSFSPAYFAKKFAGLRIGASYQSFPLPHIDMLPRLLAGNPSLAGLNVTVPYKQVVIRFLDELDATAHATNAVNCIDIRAGRLKGYNTDVIGFERSLLPLLQHHHSAALVLGTGGAAQAVCWVLRRLLIPYIVVSRTPGADAISYDALTKTIVDDHTLVVNCTPLGMYPQVDGAPDIPYQYLTDRHLLYDLVYNPRETAFLARGRQQGATIKNGLEMLHLQADASWEIWNSDLR